MGAPGNQRHKQPGFIDASENDRKNLVVFFIVSFVAHAAVFAGILMFQDVRLPKPLPPVIQVDLVSFAQVPDMKDSGLSETRDDKGVGLKSAAPSKPKPKKVKHIKPDISLKTKPKNLKALMQAQKEKAQKPKPKPAPKKEPVQKTDPAPEPRPETKTAQPEPDAPEEDSSEDQIAKALSRLKEKVQSQAGEKKGDAQASASGRRGPKGVDPLTLYHMVIQSEIQKNWVYSDVLAGVDKNLEAVVIIKILASGEIRDIFFETRSGNRYLDDSARKAILKINPLPPLPIQRPSYDMGLIFTPRGVK